MQYEIKELSSYAASILAEPKHALVHSVYRRTITLACKAEILSLQTQNSTLSPISLITELSETAMDQLCAAAGDRVMLSPSEIQIFTASGRKAVFQISSARCRLRDLSFTALPQNFDLAHLLRMLHQVLLAADASGFAELFAKTASASMPAYLTAAKQTLHTCTDALNAQDWETAADTLCSLIGLGIGLTPSGDDFLCGVLAGASLLQARSLQLYALLRERIALHLCDTNDISAAFLRCALADQVSLPVQKLLTASDADEIASAFRQIGHSSGMDTLCGIYYICTHLQDMAKFL